jgi:DNA-binding PadR family transcriptional regulator
MNGLTGFQRDILYVIAGLDKPYGLALKEELEEYYEEQINHGRLYPNLDDLVDEGLIEKGSIDDRTNSYELTEYGVLLIEERARWERERVGEQVSLAA